MPDLVFPPPKRKRSRRLRKKLRIGEFQQLGFAYDLTWAAAPSPDAQEEFVDQLLDQIVEARGLSLGGGVTCGFVAARCGSPSEADREAFEIWLRQWPGIVAVMVGPLQDAWYDAAGEMSRAG